MVRVLASVVQREGKWLVCKRPADKRHGGLWEFPGGKVEHGETLLAAARRELSEELGVQVTNCGQVLYTSEDPGSDFLIEFVGVSISGDPKPLEHDELLWAGADELLCLNLAPADAEFVRRIIIDSDNDGSHTM
jgi:8-oxo-dGTP diphosphatase